MRTESPSAVHHKHQTRSEAIVIFLGIDVSTNFYTGYRAIVDKHDSGSYSMLQPSPTPKGFADLFSTSLIQVNLCKFVIYSISAR